MTVFGNTQIAVRVTGRVLGPLGDRGSPESGSEPWEVRHRPW